MKPDVAINEVAINDDGKGQVNEVTTESPILNLVILFTIQNTLIYGKQEQSTIGRHCRIEVCGIDRLCPFLVPRCVPLLLLITDSNSRLQYISGMIQTLMRRLSVTLYYF